jgi:hypothetical protein
LDFGRIEKRRMVGGCYVFVKIVRRIVERKMSWK